jgi:hypothetical protein
MLEITGLELAKRQARWIVCGLFRHGKRAPRAAPPHLREVHLRRGRRQGQVLAGQALARILPASLFASSEHQF